MNGRPRQDTQPRATAEPVRPAGSITPGRTFQQPALLASFRDPDAAQRAAVALRRAGFQHVQVDRLEAVPVDRGELSQQPVPATLTGTLDRDRRVLAAMDPTVSGQSGDELVGDIPYLVTVVLESNGDRDKAASIVRDHGGRL